MKSEKRREIGLLIDTIKLDCLEEQVKILKQVRVASECFERISKKLIDLEEKLTSD